MNINGLKMSGYVCVGAAALPPKVVNSTIALFGAAEDRASVVPEMVYALFGCVTPSITNIVKFLLAGVTLKV